jgi:HrpA-like RNA helicase
MLLMGGWMDEAGHAPASNDDALRPSSPPSLPSSLPSQLFLLDALDSNSRLTPCGAAMARLPLDPCLAKTMLCAVTSGCAPTAAAVCALVYGEDVVCRAGTEQTREAALESRQRFEAPEVRAQHSLIHVT